MKRQEIMRYYPAVRRVARWPLGPGSRAVTTIARRSVHLHVLHPYLVLTTKKRTRTSTKRECFGELLVEKLARIPPLEALARKCSAEHRHGKAR